MIEKNESFRLTRNNDIHIHLLTHAHARTYIRTHVRWQMHKHTHKHINIYIIVSIEKRFIILYKDSFKNKII